MQLLEESAWTLMAACVPACSEPACPQCRRQMQSRRDCKRDSRFDRLMGQLYGDLHGFEAQVLLPCAHQIYRCT